MSSSKTEKMDAQKKTPPIFSYSSRELNKVDAFIEKTFGNYENVFHEFVSPDIHLDVVIVPPTESQPYYRLVTMGAGAYKMSVPKELKKYKLERAEYVICLPKDWDIRSDKEENYWPIRHLKSIARLPINCDTWLGWGHSVTANEDSSPVAPNTKLNSFLLLTALGKDNQMVKPLRLNLFETVNFYQLCPLYQEELEYKMEHSTEEFLSKANDKNDLSFIVDINRENYFA